MVTNQSVYDEMCEVYRKFLWGELVEVTRCKDCLMHGVCRLEQRLGMDGYCSEAERREE